jgi:hypothetical protein
MMSTVPKVAVQPGVAGATREETGGRMKIPLPLAVTLGSKLEKRAAERAAPRGSSLGRKHGSYSSRIVDHEIGKTHCRDHIYDPDTNRFPEYRSQPSDNSSSITIRRAPGAEWTAPASKLFSNSGRQTGNWNDTRGGHARLWGRFNTMKRQGNSLQPEPRLVGVSEIVRLRF